MVRVFLAVAARAVVQWALATLLLANGSAFCLIAAVSELFRLGPPCILCARVHRLLCSHGGDGRDALRLLLCDAHLATVDTTGPEQQPDGAPDGSSRESRDVDDQDKASALESHRVVSIGSETCEQDQDTNGRAGSGTDDDGGNSPLVSLFELAAHPRGDGEHEPPAELPRIVEGGERLTVGQLLSLRAQRRELDALRAELDAERCARAAAEEHLRQLEEQGELDREAARLAMELVHETEREKRALQQRLDAACRARAAQAHLGYAAGGEEERRCHGDNDYQSLVDFLPGSSVYSSSPDLANLLKLYTEPSNNGGNHQDREGFGPAVTVVAEEVEEEEVTVAAAGTVSSVDNFDAGDSLHERNTSCHVES